jgi:pimeloyl-ACP methyl ester carboxylesterase
MNQTLVRPIGRSGSGLRAPEALRDFGVRVSSPLESRWTWVDGYALHSRSTPPHAGVPFVLIHGLMISSLYMIPLAESLARRAEVHALDLPGFGRSPGPWISRSIPGMADVVIHWLDASGIQRCHLVANSLGCQVAADLAARHPERVASVTLTGPTIDSAAHSLPRQAARLATELLREPPRLWANHVVDFFRAGPLRIISMISQMFRDRIAEKLPMITAPALVLRGENDPIAPEGWIKECATLLPRGEGRAIPDSAHCAHYTHPGQTARAILDLIASHQHAG